MTSDQRTTWNKTANAIFAGALSLAIAVGGYWINLIDKRNAEQDAQLDDHSYRIRSNEKDIEYAIKRFEAIDEKLDRVEKKLDTVISEVRK